MGVLDDPRAPVSRRDVGDGQPEMAITVPPVQFDHVVKTKVGDQVEDVMRDHDRGRHSLQAFGLLHDGAQGRPVQMVEVGMGDQHQVNRRQITHLQPWPSNTFQDEEPTREVRVDDHILVTDLEKETRMPDECHAHLTVRDQFWLVSTTGPRCDDRMAYQAAELPGTFAKRRILQSIF